MKVLEVIGQGQIWNLLIRRIPKLLLILEINEELKEIFQVKARMYFQEDNEKRNWTSSVAN